MRAGKAAGKAAAVAAGGEAAEGGVDTQEPGDAADAEKEQQPPQQQQQTRAAKTRLQQLQQQPAVTVKSEPRTDRHSVLLQPGDKVMLLSPSFKPFATGTIMLVKDNYDCAGTPLGSGFVAVGNVVVGTTKAQLDEAAKTVFWRSNRDAGLKLGQAKYNFKTMQKAVEAKGVVVPVPQDRVAKIVKTLRFKAQVMCCMSVR
ncbi:hypothetical protein COO60DRAFT_1677827 [Scenedesmus sp. NREL 46B-D3]|nr:hypothetical protein COO60DRAFT_1677827 [Scenedesmus sp. NREL 46B-D3]